MGVSENGAPTPKMAKWWYPLDFGYPIFEHIQTVVFLAGLLVSVSQVVAWPSSRCCMLLAWGTYETLMNLFEAKVRSCRWGKMLRPLSGFNWSSLEGSKRWVFWFSRGFLMHWMTFGEPLWKMSPAGVHQFIYKQTIGSSFCGWPNFLIKITIWMGSFFGFSSGKGQSPNLFSDWNPTWPVLRFIPRKLIHISNESSPDPGLWTSWGWPTISMGQMWVIQVVAWDIGNDQTWKSPGHPMVCLIISPLNSCRKLRTSPLKWAKP